MKQETVSNSHSTGDKQDRQKMLETVETCICECSHDHSHNTEGCAAFCGMCLSDCIYTLGHSSDLQP